MGNSGFLKTYHANEARLQRVNTIHERAWKLREVLAEKKRRLAFPALMEFVRGNLKVLEEKGVVFDLVCIPGANEPPAELGREIKKVVELSHKFYYSVDEDRILLVMGESRAYFHSSSEEEAMKQSPYEGFGYTLEKLEKLLATDGKWCP